MIWSCVLDRKDKNVSSNSEIDLPLLKGLLQEVRIELLVEDFLFKSGFHSHDPTYKAINIIDDIGFNDYKELD